MKDEPGTTWDELRPEYDLDYTKAIRGNYYARLVAEGAGMVVLEPDVAEVFPDSSSVNRALRSLIEPM